MKTMKNVLLTGLLMISLMATASNEKGAPKVGNVTITEQNETVAVSVLNTQNATYTLFIYSEDGTMVFKSTLGSHTTLGKAFNFQTAQEGVYTFKLVTNAGETFVKDIKIG
ncbi:MAG: hypothetical protein R2793_04575 [Flavobacteriaceae bacterium]